MNLTEKTPEREQKKPVAGIIIYLLISLLFICTSCKKKNTDLSRDQMQKQEGIPVELVTVRESDIFITVDVSGQLDADEKVLLNTNNSGIVTQLMIREGDYVRKGQTVAVIEPYDLEDQLSQAQAAVHTASMRLIQAKSKALLRASQVEGSIRQAEESLKGAEAQYNQARAALITTREQQSIVEEGSRKQEIAVAQEAVSQAEANFREAKLDLGRMEQLLEKGAISQQQMDIAQVRHDVAEAQYNTALSKLDLAREGSRIQEKEAAKQQVQIAEEKVLLAQTAINQSKEALKIAQDNRMEITVASHEVDVAQAAVDEARANLAIVSRKLEKAYVKSPINGYVTKRYVDMGQYAGGQGPSKIADIFNPRTIYFAATVSDTDIERIKVGMNADITIDSIPDKSFKGAIKDIIPGGDPDSKQFIVKIMFNNKDSKFKTGMFARGKVILAVHKDVLVIPKNTVKKNEGEEKNFVYINDNGHAAEREVITGPSMEGIIEITKGLSQGEKVISTGTVKDGDLLKVIHEE